MFNADKGYAHGVWIPHDTGWAIEFDGVSADGTPTTAVNVLSRVKDALVWKSTNRTIAGRSVPDTEESCSSASNQLSVFVVPAGAQVGPFPRSHLSKGN